MKAKTRRARAREARGYEYLGLSSCGTRPFECHLEEKKKERTKTKRQRGGSIKGKGRRAGGRSRLLTRQS